MATVPSNRSIYSQFFVLNARGEGIISRDYRGDTPKGVQEIFFQHVKLQKGDVLPIFTKENINFVFVRGHTGLYFVLTSWRNVSPFFTIELLLRLSKVFKDYCGVITEEAIRANFVLIYELLDEIMDFGLVQSTSTEVLKGFVHTPPISVIESASEGAIEKLIQMQLKTAPSTSANRSVQAQSKRDEIFIDLLEKLTVLFSASGNVLSARIDGSIVMRSFLKGAPELRLQLNEDLVVGKGASRYGRVGIDDISFHECARTNTFEFDRGVVFHPPDGEFVLLSYRTTDDFKLPFRILPFVEEIDAKKLDVIIKVQMDVPAENFAHNIFIHIPVPKSSLSASLELPVGAVGQSWEYRQGEKMVIWAVKKLLPAQREMTAKLKVNLSGALANAKKEIGKISMLFEVPNYCVSNVTIKSLKTTDGSPIPARWVRYITQAASYVQRL